MRYIALTSSSITRDAQVYAGPARDPHPLDEGWTDWNEARIYIGIYEGTEDEARAWAARYAGIAPGSVELIPIAKE